MILLLLLLFYKHVVGNNIKCEITSLWHSTSLFLEKRITDEKEYNGNSLKMLVVYRFLFKHMYDRLYLHSGISHMLLKAWRHFYYACVIIYLQQTNVYFLGWGVSLTVITTYFFFSLLDPVFAMYTNSPQGANNSGYNIRDISSPLRVMSLSSPITPLGALIHSPQLAQKVSKGRFLQ